MAFQRASMVRTALARRWALSFAKAISIGLRSGLQGGRNKTRAPLSRMAFLATGLLWAGRLSMLQQKSWDPSVKSLTPFPRILRMLDANLEWTEQLGEAYLANPA